MKVLKFGGTSLGSPDRMQHVADLVLQEDRPCWVVLSALSGTTNSLYEIVDSIKNGKANDALEHLNKLKNHYTSFTEDLFGGSDNGEIREEINTRFKTIRDHILAAGYSLSVEKEIVAQGEFISTFLFSRLLLEKSVDIQLISALDIMRLNSSNEPDMAVIKDNIEHLNDNPGEKIFVTQGFVCMNSRDEIDNFRRGGSDFSASIIGAVLNADEIQIWTDIDGMHNNDPRVVKATKPISKLTFDEAAELAYFGAKVLHPSTILPARLHNIPVRIKNTLNPQAEGTVISSVLPGSKGGAKAVAAKDGITAIKIRSSRMLMAYGFLRKVFEVFEKYATPIDMITTSEVAVSLTIDNQEHLLEIIAELEPFGEVEVDYDMSIICIVGNGLVEDRGLVSKIFSSLDDIQVRMISYGGSRNNISVLVKSDFKKQALDNLNQGLFGL